MEKWSSEVSWCFISEQLFFSFAVRFGVAELP